MVKVMMRVWNARLGLAVWLLLMPALAFAQTAGSIAGTVKDTSGAVLPGVTVDASSPALIEKVRTVVTDGEGLYKIVELRPGTYTVTFTLPGFSIVRREGIELTTGFTAAVNAELKVGDLSETITVSGQGPVVDIQNTRQQVILTRAVIDAIPTGKSFQNLGTLIPGIVKSVSGPSAGQDVGGQSGQDFSSMAIHGGKLFDQRIEIDGMAVNAWTGASTAGTAFADGNFEEYAIDVGVKSAETQTGGVRINMIPKEGGNTFHGAFFGNVAGTRLQSENLSDELRRLGLPDANRLKALWSVNPTLGGPIMQSKLWFFAAYTRSRSDSYVGGLYDNKDPAAWDYVPDFTRQAVNDQSVRDTSARLTWQGTPKNKFTVFYDNNLALRPHHVIGSTGTATPRTSDGSPYYDIPTKLYQATWSAPVTNRVLIEAGTSYARAEVKRFPEPESVAPEIIDTGLNLAYRSISVGSAYGYSDMPISSSRGSVSYVTGSHATKVGFNLILGAHRQAFRILGDVRFTACPLVREDPNPDGAVRDDRSRRPSHRGHRRRHEPSVSGAEGRAGTFHHFDASRLPYPYHACHVM
jgi:carboxypeptidase family protein